MSAKLAVPSKPVRRKAALPRDKSPVTVQEKTLDEMAEMFRVLADKSRLKILLALAHQGEMHVNSLCDLLGAPGKRASQPAVSHHLTLLRMYRLVSFRREGKHNFYRVDADHLRDVLEQFFADSGNGQKLFQFPGFSLAYRSK